MPRNKANYPFVPKSTAYLVPGQFWSIPLPDGRHARGRVLELACKDGKRDARLFLAGLMDWVGDLEPEVDDFAGSKILEHGQVHVKTINECGGAMVGYRPLEVDALQIPLSLDEFPQSPGCRVRQGFTIPRTRPYPTEPLWPV